MKGVPVIAIDGTSGVGKGTLARLLAKKLGWHLLDSGAVYRAHAWALMQHKVSLRDLESMVSRVQAVHFVWDDQHGPMVDGQACRAHLHGEEVGLYASTISALEGVRAHVNSHLRQCARHPGLVADGRDMGTVVFPDAVVKLFLDAPLHIRAQRRADQLLTMGQVVNMADVCSWLERRDKRDSERSIAPLKPAPDAILVDTGVLGVDDVLSCAWAAIERNRGRDTAPARLRYAGAVSRKRAGFFMIFCLLALTPSSSSPWKNSPNYLNLNAAPLIPKQAL